MPGPRDKDLIVRLGSVGNLTTTANLAQTLSNGNPRERGLGLSVLVPSQSGTSPTLKVTVKTLTDGKEIEVTHTENIDDATTFPFFLHLPMPASDDSSWQVDLVVAGTSPDFGAVEAWMEPSELARVPKA